MTNIKDNYIVDDNKEVEVIDNNTKAQNKELLNNKDMKKKDKTPEEIAEMSKKRKQYHIEYFEKNKNKLQEKIKCPECGHEYMKYNKTSHIITKAHQNGLLVSKLTSELNALKNDSSN